MSNETNTQGLFPGTQGFITRYTGVRSENMKSYSLTDEEIERLLQENVQLTLKLERLENLVMKLEFVLRGARFMPCEKANTYDKALLAIYIANRDIKEKIDYGTTQKEKPWFYPSEREKFQEIKEKK